MRLIIFNPYVLHLPRDKEDPNRKIEVRGTFRHTHHETVKGVEMFELENDSEVGKVSLYLNKYELARLRAEVIGDG